MDILQRIQNYYPEATRKQRGIADYLLENPEDICYITLAQLSQQTSSSELTLLRFCQKIGCSSFLTLKDEFREHTHNIVKRLSSPSYFIPDHDIADPSAKQDLLRKICGNEALASAEFFSSVELEHIIATAGVIQKVQRIFIFAHDISKILGEFLEARLRLLHFEVCFIDLADSAKVQNSLQKLTPQDLAIFFAFPKYYHPLASISKKAAQKEAVLLTITDSMSAPSAQYSQHLFLCHTATKVFYNSLTLPMALLNLLVSYLVIDMASDSDCERGDFLDSSPFDR